MTYECLEHKLERRFREVVKELYPDISEKWLQKITVMANFNKKHDHHFSCNAGIILTLFLKERDKQHQEQ